MGLQTASIACVCTYKENGAEAQLVLCSPFTQRERLFSHKY